MPTEGAHFFFVQPVVSNDQQPNWNTFSWSRLKTESHMLAASYLHLYKKISSTDCFCIVSRCHVVWIFENGLFLFGLKFSDNLAKRDAVAISFWFAVVCKFNMMLGASWLQKIYCNALLLGAHIQLFVVLRVFFLFSILYSYIRATNCLNNLIGRHAGRARAAGSNFRPVRT